MYYYVKPIQYNAIHIFFGVLNMNSDPPTNFRKNINVPQKLISLLKGNSKWGKICKGCTNPDHPFNKWNFSGFL